MLQGWSLAWARGWELGRERGSKHCDHLVLGHVHEAPFLLIFYLLRLGVYSTKLEDLWKMIVLRRGVGGGLREGGEWEANSKAARIKQRLGRH